jgi:hypothetical protein
MTEGAAGEVPATEMANIVAVRERSAVDISSQGWDVIAVSAIAAGIVAARLHESHPYFKDLSSMWADPAGRSFLLRGGLTGFYSRFGAPYITKFATELFDGYGVRRRAFLAAAVTTIGAVEYGIFERLGLDGKKGVVPFWLLSVGLIYVLDALERRGKGVEWMYERAGAALNRAGLEFGAATQPFAAHVRGDAGLESYLLEPTPEILRLCK